MWKYVDSHLFSFFIGFLIAGLMMAYDDYEQKMKMPANKYYVEIYYNRGISMKYPILHEKQTISGTFQDSKKKISLDIDVRDNP